MSNAPQRGGQPGCGTALALVLCILLGAGAYSLPYLATGDERCLVHRAACRWWWLP